MFEELRDTTRCGANCRATNNRQRLLWVSEPGHAIARTMWLAMGPLPRRSPPPLERWTLKRRGERGKFATTCQNPLSPQFLNYARPPHQSGLNRESGAQAFAVWLTLKVLVDLHVPSQTQGTVCNFRVHTVRH